jgi:hypothetical protein
MTSGDLGPVVMQSGLEFRDVVHEGTREWNEWLATGVLPDGVATVVMKEGDPAWERLRDDAGFTARYHRVFTTGGSPTIEVWRVLLDGMHAESAPRAPASGSDCAPPSRC